MVNGPSKNVRLAKFKPNSRGLVVSYFLGGPSRSLDFFFDAKEVSGSQKMYQSRRVARSHIYHSTPLHVIITKNRLTRVLFRLTKDCYCWTLSQSKNDNILPKRLVHTFYSRPFFTTRPRGPHVSLSHD